jgi:hypothetical protein
VRVGFESGCHPEVLRRNYRPTHHQTTMKKLSFSFVFVLLLSALLNAQDSTNITKEINQLFSSSSAINKGDEVNLLSFKGVVRSAIHEEENHVLFVDLKNKEGEILIKQFGAQFSGYIFLKNEKISYRLISKNNEKLAVKCLSSQVLMQVTSTPSTDVLGDPQASAYNSDKRLPVGNSLMAGAYQLQSNPGATTVLYLDFDGEDMTGWGYDMNKINASGADDESIKTIWEVVTADFIAFDVNVTTDRAVFDSYNITKRVMCVFGNSPTGFINTVAGYSKLNIFGTNCGAVVKYSSGYNSPLRNSLAKTGHVGSHELGHAMGLSHDGDQATGYYGGHSDWAPVMGNGFTPYITWSIGDYNKSTTYEDDIAIIGSQMGYLADDHLKSLAIVFGDGDSINPQDNHGIIENRNDVDTFYFETSTGGRVHLKLSTVIDYTDLDIDLTLMNSTFSVLAHNNIYKKRGAEIDLNVPAGKFYVLIKAGSELTAVDGFTTYSSFGYYEMAGTIDGFKKAITDVAVISLDGFEQSCGDRITGDVTIKNIGSSAVNGGQINFYIDGVLNQSLPVNSNLNAGDVFTLSALEILTSGNHVLKAEYAAAQGFVEGVVSNNSMSKAYTIENGVEHMVSTDAMSYTGLAPLTWKITNKLNAATVKDGTLIPLDKGNTLITQKFCLDNGCYNFQISGDFKLCGAYSAFQNGKTYVKGDIVLYQNTILYKAKWWTQNAPGGNDWDYMGTCNNGSFFMKLDDVFNNSEIAKANSAGFTSPLSQDFCVNTTSINELSNNVNIYPNPVNDVLNINSTELISRIEIIDLSGRTIYSENTANKILAINVAHLSEGIYILKISQGNAQLNVKFVK